MDSLRRTLFAASLAAIVALGCGPSVRTVVGASPGIGSTSFLTSATPSMVIEVIPTSRHHPSTQALDLLMARATERCAKPGGVTLQVDDEVPLAPSEARRWSYADLIAFDAAHAKLTSTPGRAVLTVLYLDGLYGPNNAAIAISYTGSSIAIFTDMLAPKGPEGPALVHELGHQLGLVNGTTPQVEPHEDPAHPLHDASPSCVMFFSLDPIGEGTSPTDFCAKCRADLKAAGGQ